MRQRTFGRLLFIIVMPAFAWASDPTDTPSTVSLPMALGVPLGGDRSQIEALFTEAHIPEVNRDNDMTVYKEPLAKINNGGATVLFFYDGKLAKMVTVLDVESQQVDPYISRYEELKTGLTEKYGKPKNSSEYIADDYKSHPLLGIKTGKGQYVSVWHTPDLNIALILRGDNFNISFSLHYEYRELFEQFQKRQKKREKDVL